MIGFAQVNWADRLTPAEYRDLMRAQAVDRLRRQRQNQPNFQDDAAIERSNFNQSFNHKSSSDVDAIERPVVDQGFSNSSPMVA